LLVLAAGFQREAFDCRFLLTDMRYADFVERCGMPAAPWAGAKPDLPRADVVAIDGYHFDVGLPSQWSAQTGCTTLVVDDLAERPTRADVVLNHNIYGAELDYETYGARLLLTGPQYALVDPAFAALASRARPTAGRVVISFGGTDDGYYGAAAARALLERDADVAVDVVLPRSAASAQQVADDFPGRCDIHVAPVMVDRLAAATVYVGAAGVTLLEAIAAGRDIVVCGIVDNQRKNIRSLKALSASAFDEFVPDQMADVALQLLSSPGTSALPAIDGHGAERVVKAIVDLRGRGRGSQRAG